jgi:uncharacterized membrane protein
MNFAHLHLLLNHFPIIGTIVGLGLFLVSFFGKNDDLRRGSLIIFAAVALLTIPTFLSGVGAQLMIKGKPGVSDAFIQRHEGAAMLALWFMEATGALALIGLWQFHRISRPASWNVSAVLLFSLLTVGLMARTGNTGGDIRHPEIRVSQQATPTEGTVGSIVHAFEPTPDKFSQGILGWWGGWWWAFIMVLHFIGLALLIGTIGALDIRIMGFAKQLPIAPLHRFVPWAMAGLGINIVTGMLAFIGQPQNYIYNPAFWLKMLALLLLGLNAAAFYLTGIFDGVERLGAGEDAPISAKLIAASSLFLCFAVLTLGRYIQPIGDSLRPGSN